MRARPPSPSAATLASLLALAALASFAGWGAAGCADAPEAPRHLVLVSVDTLRADRLGCYGHPRPTSPHLDALAAEGVLFEEAASTAPWTRPAHASLLTGLLPAAHGVRTVRDRLPRDVESMAERLAARGFATAAVVNNFHLSPESGLARGFRHHVTVPVEHGAEGAAAAIVDRAVAWLEQPRSRPFFLFLHFFDVHSDYRSRPDVERAFVERRNPADGSSAQLRALSAGGGPVDAAQAEYLGLLYDAGIRQLDAELGRLFDALDRLGLRDETLVVVTSDHGEEFGEHGGVSHGDTHYREVLRVPLVLRGPGVPAGIRVATPVSLVDVAPTALDLLRIDAPAPIDGRSLRRTWAGGAPEEAVPVIAEAAPAVEKDTRASVRVGRYKLIVDEEAGTRALYDLEDDPGEQRDLAAARPEVADRLAAILGAHRRGARDGDVGPPLSEADRARLRALGYVVSEDGDGRPGEAAR